MASQNHRVFVTGPMRNFTISVNMGTDRANILYIENSIGMGGSTISLSNLVSNIDRRAYNPQVILSRKTQKEYFDRCCHLQEAVEVIRCGESLKKKPAVSVAAKVAGLMGRRVQDLVFSVLSLLDLPFVTVPYVFKLYLYSRKRKIDLIQHNNGFDIASILLARLLGVPIIAYQRGVEWNSPMVRFFSKFVDLYIANSEATRKSLLSLGISPGKTEVICPPVDFSRFDNGIDSSEQRREFKIKSDELCFGILGALQEFKGHKTVLKAAKKVMEVFPESKCFIIGDVPDGSENYREELAALAGRLGIGDRVVFTGYREDIPEMIQILDVVIQASLSTEGFGRVIVEAMAMKKPVVATDVGGPAEIVRDGYNGFLVPPGDDSVLADRITTLLNDRRLANEFAERAYRDALRRFSLPNHINMLQDIYSKMIAGPSGQVRTERLAKKQREASND